MASTTTHLKQIDLVFAMEAMACRYAEAEIQLQRAICDDVPHDEFTRLRRRAIRRRQAMTRLRRAVIAACRNA